MIPVLTSEQMRTVDAQVIAKCKIPGVVLMENAGRAVAKHVLAMLGAGLGKVVVVCGAGNNGGDGFVVARVLQEAGALCELFVAAELDRLRGDAARHRDAFLACGGHAFELLSDTDLQEASLGWAAADVVVDALLGTGLKSELRGIFAKIVLAMNQSTAPILSIDIPSGLRADDGRCMGQAVLATQCVTLAAPKVANVSAPGFVHCGQLHIEEIGIPASVLAQAANAGLVQRGDLRANWEPDGENSHKGIRGHALVIGGARGKRGAGRMAGLSALRGGAGLVTLASASLDEGAPSVLMTASIGDLESLPALWAGKSSVLIGPGMHSGPVGKQWTEHVLAHCALPLVVDADALNHVGTNLSAYRSQALRIVTPHPGEAGRMLGIPAAEVQADRLQAVRRLAAKTGAIVILKGARTCICDGSTSSGFVSINPSGGPELGTAGTGDVLAGLLTALLARGISGWHAAQIAVFWHGKAGQIAKEKLGGAGVIATDVIDALPEAQGVLLR